MLELPSRRGRAIRAIGAGCVLAVALSQASSAAGLLPTYGAAQLLFNPNRPPVAAATADFNCDGLMDVVVAFGDGSGTTYPLAFYLADGHGSFVDGTSQVLSGSQHQTMYASSIVLGDFNGDGRTDVFIPDQSNQSLGGPGFQNTLLLSTPDCHLVDATANIPQQQDFTWGAAAADVDGDGDLDLIVVNDWGPDVPVPVQLWLNDGSGHFSIANGALPATFTDTIHWGYKAAAFVDVNGDGAVDLVLGADNRQASSVVLLNDGSGHFTQLANAMPAKPVASNDIVYDIKSADFNHDGKPDLVLSYMLRASNSGRWLQFLINNGDGTFRDETSQRLPQDINNTSVWSWALRLLDIDGDGNLDIAARPTYSFDHLFATADANGVFTPVTLVSGNLDAVVTPVDVNGNGHRDLLSVYTNRVTLWPDTGSVLPPGFPQDVRARAMPDRVRLTWPYVWSATSYQIWRSATAGSAGSQIGTTSALTYDDLTATTTPMSYTVRAVNGAATSVSSAAVGAGVATPPTVVTTAATAVGQFGATLNATANPNGASTTAQFQYGFASTYGFQAAASSPGSGTSPVAVSASLSSLSCNSTYHFRVAATNAGGSATGTDQTFTTSPCPPPTLQPYGAWVDLAWQNAADIDALIDKLAAAGAHNVRMAFRWYMIEPAKGQWAFDTHDAIVAKLRARGIEILGILAHPPDWAISGPSGITPPNSDADWQDYISQTATHFRGQVANWEIWNEENLHYSWYPQPDVVRYVQMLKIAFNTIRSADPNATVVLGGIGGNGVFMGWEQPNERDYLQALYDHGAKDYFDVVAIHPYDHPIQEGFGVLNGFVHDALNVMEANGDGNKRLWLTETGWGLGNTGWSVTITETDQANWLTTIFQGRPTLGADRIYWFDFKDAPNDPDVHGMVRHDLSLRPAYYAFQGVTSSPPTITTQPLSQLVSTGHAASLSVAASGAEPYSYQWYVGASGTTTNPIGGATGSGYTTPTLTSTTSYWIRITNANGTADSTTATMTVGTPPTITTQPQSQTIPSGQTAILNVIASGTATLTYQWYIGTSGTTTTPIAGATASTYTTPSLLSPASYWVRVSNGYAPNADSTTAVITFGAAPVITTAPQSQRIGSGQTATLSVAATGTGTLTYQWYAGASGSTTNPIGGAIGSAYTTPALTSTSTYWVRVSNAYPPAANSATATITVGAVATDALVANGKTLTVTSANAVATFNGLDLVGFVNSLTNESYLKKPSNGELAQVDAISSTGPALQSTNWTVGTETGTGLPLATITTSDSLRTLTLTVKIDPASQEIVLHSGAGVTSAGVRGASWSIAGLDLTAGRWIVPTNSGVAFDRDHPGLNTYIQYPYTWQAQMGVFEATLGSALLYSTDSQHYFKQLRQTSRGDSALDVAVYTEATAPWPSATTVPNVEWRLKAFAGDWRAAATPFRDWILATSPPVSNAAHPWVSNIQTVVEMNGQTDSALLAPLAAQVNPSQTLLYLVGWRGSDYDVNYPDYTPGSGAASFVSAAHALGFKVMLHTDLIGVSPNNADYAAVQQYQSRTPETLQLMGWNWDQPPSTPGRYGLIDPAAAAFRSLWISRISAAVTALNPDALHLDFTAMYNDGNGPIEGRTFTQGEDLFNQQIIAAFPNIALGAEEETDFTYRYHSFAQAGLDPAFPATGHPIVTFLFSPQIRYYGHLATPEVSVGSFKSYLIQQQRRAVFPMWRLDQPSDLDTSNVDNARFVGMVQSWQSHAFQPAWTADWAGALVRYQGLAGSMAALTDAGTVTALGTTDSTLFQLAHDANQVTSGSFINRWPAFDVATLYGLNPATLYFLDPLPRPDATHATSLPLGVQVGAGTLASTSFAHIEVVPPFAFDFTDLTHAHVGVQYQGADYPLGYGAIAQPQTNTAGGVTRSVLFLHPPYQGQIGGETFVEYSVPVPVGGVLGFSVGIDDGSTCTDGVTFRVTAGGTELWHQNYGRDGWHDVVLSLSAYAGTTVPLRLISNPGPASNPNCDWSLWSEVAIVGPSSGITVPVTMAIGSALSGFDGDGAFSSTAPLTGTVSTLPVPGAFTIFTQPGSPVANGTNLATLPFEIWHQPHGELAQLGALYGAGSIGAETSGGITKNPAIWAVPASGEQTIFSWVLHLPAGSPLTLGWSVGMIDGAFSDDGVDFDVFINGRQYSGLTTGVRGDNHWTLGQLDLSRWQGQNILVELITDSRGNWYSDWPAWADLVLTPSSVTCSYSVPASASIGAIGGSFTANVTATPICSWSASSNVPWLTISAGSGSGNGAVSYVAAANAGPARSGTLTIGGKTVTVNQAGQAGTCTVAISPTSTTFLSTASAGSVTVTTPSFCSWTVSNLPSWISTTSASSGAGSGSWQFSVAPNASGVMRSQVVSVAGANFTATQSATGSLSLVNTFSPNALTISTSEGAPYGDCDFWLMGGCSGSTNLGYGPTRVMRLYICLSGEVTFSDCAQAPTPTGPLSPTILNDISTRLASAAGSGVRLMIRFIYNMGHPGTTAPDPTAPDAPLAAILTHIDQLAPILIQNKDVIFALEAGFIGTWGEWHDSTNGNDTAAAHKAVLDKELSYFNGAFPVLVRYPGDVIVYAGGPVPPAGLGIHNDYYDSNSDDGATFNTCIPNIGYCLPGYSKEQLMSYTEQVSAGAMFAGEFGETNTTMQSCAALDAYSYRFHLQSIALLGGFAPQVTFPFLQSSGCATSFLNKVGTRIELQRAAISGNVAPGSTLSVGLTLVNAGYGRVIRARPVTFVLISGGAVVAQYPISLQDMDLRQLASSPTPAPRTFQFNVVLPPTLAPDTLSAALWIPDPGTTLTSQAAYALPLNSVDQNQRGIFDASTGYNMIGTFANACSMATSSPGQTFGASSAAGSVAITAANGCTWTVDNPPAWTTTTSGASGAGPGAWRFTVDANGGATRTQSMTVAGQPFTLTQLAVPVRTGSVGARSRFDLADTSAENWSSIEAVGGRSYCAQLAPAPNAQAPASPMLTAFRGDGATILAGGTAGATRACFIAPATETILIKATQTDNTSRSHLLSVVETTLWANWFYIGGANSSYTILRNTTDVTVNATLTWRAADTGISVGTKTVAIPPRGIAYYDARPPNTSGAAAAGSVEVAHDGEPQAIVGSQTTLSAVTGLSFDTLLMQRRQP